MNHPAIGEWKKLQPFMGFHPDLQSVQVHVGGAFGQVFWLNINQSTKGTIMKGDITFNEKTGVFTARGDYAETFEQIAKQTGKPPKEVMMLFVRHGIKMALERMKFYRYMNKETISRLERFLDRYDVNFEELTAEILRSYIRSLDDDEHLREGVIASILETRGRLKRKQLTNRN